MKAKLTTPMITVVLVRNINTSYSVTSDIFYLDGTLCDIHNYISYFDNNGYSESFIYAFFYIIRYKIRERYYEQKNPLTSRFFLIFVHDTLPKYLMYLPKKIR